METGSQYTDLSSGFYTSNDKKIHLRKQKYRQSQIEGQKHTVTD